MQTLRVVTFDLWLGAMGPKWGVALPSIRDYEEAGAATPDTIQHRRIRADGTSPAVVRSRMRRTAHGKLTTGARHG